MHSPSMEDIALGLQLVQGGRRIFLDKRIQVKHLKRWTLLKHVARRYL